MEGPDLPGWTVTSLSQCFVLLVEVGSTVALKYRISVYGLKKVFVQKISSSYQSLPS